MRLTQQQGEHFIEHGWLVVEEVFSPAEVAVWQRSADALAAQARGLAQNSERFRFKGASQVQQIAEPHELDGVWLDLAKDARLLDLVEGLLGPNIQLYYSMIMWKQPREGFEAHWHQDFAFFVHNRADLLACMVAIDDATLDNGCLRVISGSHKLGLLNHFKEGRFSGVLQGDPPLHVGPEVALPVKAGGVLFWHSLTLHASHANRSERSRRGIIFEYKNPEARLLAGSFNARLEVRPTGLMVRGRDPNGGLLGAY
jgi:phytanoyl-CoA hydroxylase